MDTALGRWKNDCSGSESQARLHYDFLSNHKDSCPKTWILHTALFSFSLTFAFTLLTLALAVASELPAFVAKLVHKVMARPDRLIWHISDAEFSATCWCSDRWRSFHSWCLKRGSCCLDSSFSKQRVPLEGFDQQEGRTSAPGLSGGVSEHQGDSWTHIAECKPAIR